MSTPDRHPRFGADSRTNDFFPTYSDDDVNCAYDPETWDVAITPETRTAVALCSRCPSLAWCRAETDRMVRGGVPPLGLVQAGQVWGWRGQPRDRMAS